MTQTLRCDIGEVRPVAGGPCRLGDMCTCFGAAEQAREISSAAVSASTVPRSGVTEDLTSVSATKWDGPTLLYRGFPESAFGESQTFGIRPANLDVPAETRALAYVCEVTLAGAECHCDIADVDSSGVHISSARLTLPKGAAGTIGVVVTGAALNARGQILAAWRTTQGGAILRAGDHRTIAEIIDLEKATLEVKSEGATLDVHAAQFKSVKYIATGSADNAKFASPTTTHTTGRYGTKDVFRPFGRIELDSNYLTKPIVAAYFKSLERIDTKPKINDDINPPASLELERIGDHGHRYRLFAANEFWLAGRLAAASDPTDGAHILFENSPRDVRHPEVFTAHAGEFSRRIFRFCCESGVLRGEQATKGGKESNLAVYRISAEEWQRWLGADGRRPDNSVPTLAHKSLTARSKPLEVGEVLLLQNVGMVDHATGIRTKTAPAYRVAAIGSHASVLQRVHLDGEPSETVFLIHKVGLPTAEQFLNMGEFPHFYFTNDRAFALADATRHKAITLGTNAGLTDWADELGAAYRVVKGDSYEARLRERL